MNKHTSPVTLGALLISMGLLMSAPASAQSVTWCIEEAKFTDQTALTGFFEYDASQESVRAFNIETVAAGDFSGTSYTSELGYAQVDTRNNQTNNGLIFYPDQDSSDDIGEPRVKIGTFTDEGEFLLSLLANPALDEIALTFSTYECINCSPSRRLETGKLVRSVSGQCGAGVRATAIPVSSSSAWSLLFLFALLSVVGLARLK